MSNQCDPATGAHYHENPLPSCRCGALRLPITRPPVCVLPTITGDAAGLWLFESILLHTFDDVTSARIAELNINSAYQEWMSVTPRDGVLGVSQPPWTRDTTLTAEEYDALLQPDAAYRCACNWSKCRCDREAVGIADYVCMDCIAGVHTK
jgi:hypothetical protein